MAEPKELRQMEKEIELERSIIADQYETAVKAVVELQEKCNQPGFRMLFKSMKDHIKAINVPAAEVEKKNVDTIHARVEMVKSLLLGISQPVRDLNQIIEDSRGKLWEIKHPIRFEFDMENGIVIEK